MLYEELRTTVIEYARRMAPDRLIKGTSGNVSARDGDVVAITPGAMDYDRLRVEDIPLVTLDGDLVDGASAPSSELDLHLELYRRHGFGAVVHTHSTYATVLSTTVDELPAIHYMIASLGGPVPVARYERYGSPELATVVADAMEGRSAVIMGGHGAVTGGGDLRQAYTRALNLEWMSEVFVTASGFGRPRLLDADEVRLVGERMRTRGYLGAVAR